MARSLAALLFILAALPWEADCHADDDLKAFLGNLHSHTSYSDGSGLPEEAYLHARRSGLDFLAITEHNHAIQIKPKDRQGVPIGKDHSLYIGPSDASLIPTAKRHNKDGAFVALYGQEFSTISQGNHANVFEVDDVITSDAGHFEMLVNDWLPSHLDSAQLPAIIQFNHPSTKLRHSGIEYGRDDFGSEKNWLAAMGRHARLIEILNGPGLRKDDGQEPEEFEADFKYYLNLGFHLGPTGDQDNHYKTWGTLTDARTGIIAPELTKARLLEAIRSRHVFATKDKNLRVIVRFVYEGMPPGRTYFLCGDIIEVPPPAGTALKIIYTIEDDDEPDAEYDIEVLADVIGGGDRATTVAQASCSGNTEGPQAIEGAEYAGGRQYFYLRINQIDADGNEDRLWTAPIWFDHGHALPTPDEPSDLNAASVGAEEQDEAQYVASKRSKIYHTDPSCRDAQSIAEKNRITGRDAARGRMPHKGCPR